MAWIYKKLKEEDYEGMEEMWSSFPDCVAVHYDDGSTCLAASDSQDGFEVTLTTDKEEYSKGEEIAATLTVTNTNDTAVSNVSLENLILMGISWRMARRQPNRWSL